MVFLKYWLQFMNAESFLINTQNKIAKITLRTIMIKNATRVTVKTITLAVSAELRANIRLSVAVVVASLKSVYAIATIH